VLGAIEGFLPEIVFLFAVRRRFGRGTQARYISSKRPGGQSRHDTVAAVDYSVAKAFA
jgi:hypothetical protein